MPDTTSGPSTASLLGGAALVGAAAGYALLAFRFRNFASTANNKGRFTSGSAEMRAAGAFTKDWVRSMETEGANEGRFRSHKRRAAGEQTHRAHEEQRQHATNVFGKTPGAPAWALRELGLRDSGATLEEAKAAYRARAKVVHPDSPNGDEAAFKRVHAAWEAVQASSSA